MQTPSLTIPATPHIALPPDLDRGFPWDLGMALDCGLDDHALRAHLAAGTARRLLRGVYVAASAPDTLSLRLAGLALVVDEAQVVTDGTAAWVHAGDSVLAPGEHLALQPPNVFDARRGHRMRRPGVRSGQRDLLETDVVEMGGVRVTTPVRTATDVARLQHGQRALASLDGLLRETDLTKEEIAADLPRFRGFRGIVQARQVVPWADGRSDSYGESASRYGWLTTPGLPPPQLQVPVEVAGHVFYLDLADEALTIGVEYDGERWHGPDRAVHDDWRRSLIAEIGWLLIVLRKHNVFGRHRDLDQILVRAFAERREALRQK